MFILYVTDFTFRILVPLPVDLDRASKEEWIS
jgi:hypothetical protein